MEHLTLSEIRKKFIDFFVSKGHLKNDSFSLIPGADEKSLLLINSGMAPLKKFFSGVKVPPSKRMTTSQKCIRTADIDNIGKTKRHATFFEMLGSFSFGDYFKRESIAYGYEFIKDVLKMPMDEIWVSVYEEDEESYNIWANEIGFPKERIVKLGKDDNFWEIGLGPCGPCSEIYFDRGEKYSCGKKDCKPGCECERYIEFWNHVFTEFNKNEDGSYSPLDKKNIDTGMGLERIATIMQGVDSIYDIDSAKFLVEEIEKEGKVKYSEDGSDKVNTSIRIITDHIKASTFLVSDGLVPSNNERGYVLRKLIRRLITHLMKLNIREGFISNLALKVIDYYKDEFKNLNDNKENILKVLGEEEEKFRKTIKNGLEIIDKATADDSKNKEEINADFTFKLYDTYGFPFDLTKELLEEKNIKVSEEEFNKKLEEQKTRSKGAIKNKEGLGWEKSIDLSNIPKTNFIGYNTLEDDSKILSIYDEEKNKIDEINGDGKYFFILDKTPFYALSGGQISDKGFLIIKDKKFEVVDILKNDDIFIHEVEVKNAEGVKLNTGDNVKLIVSKFYRNQISRNHTGVHLLHRALNIVLGKGGSEITQKGSFVSDELLRLDFNFERKLSLEEIEGIEDLVNAWICEGYEVSSSEMSLEEAKKIGATALFDDKYSDLVRVVRINQGDEELSLELCGGTHVKNISSLGGFNIISETSVSSGIRRIEAITSNSISKELRKSLNLENDLALMFSSKKEDILIKIMNLVSENKELIKKNKELLKDGNNNVAREKDFIKIADKNLYIKEVNLSINEAKSIVDTFYEKEKIVSVLIVDNKDKETLIVGVSNDLVKSGLKANEIVKKLVEKEFGRGGGKENLSQIGIAKTDRENALVIIKNILEEN